MNEKKRLSAESKRHVEVKQLVSALQRIHVGQSEPSCSSQQEQTYVSDSRDDARSRHSLIGSGLENNRRLNNAIREALGHDFPQLHENSTQGNHLYRSYQRRFEDLEAKFQEHSERVDNIVRSADFSRAAPLVQETITIQCRSGGRSGGRFRCLNTDASGTTFTVSTGKFTNHTGELLADAVLNIPYRTITLSPGESRIVDISIDLSKCRQIDEGQLHTWIEMSSPARAALRVWIDIEVYD